MALERLAEPRDADAPSDYLGATDETKIKSRVKPRVHKPLHVALPVPTKHRVRLVKRGWETYSGVIAGAQFENAMSVEPLSQVIIDRIAALFSIVDEEGNPVGFRTRVAEAKAAEVAVLDPMQTLADSQAAAAELEAAMAPAVDGERIIYPHDVLLAIADKKGIAGLREIGDPLGVKGRAIPDLIQAILNVQDNVAAKAE